jgi:hypothetical protein
MADKRTSNVLYEIDPNASVESSYYVPSEEDFEEDDLLAVPAKEFEREYEVK